jgi:protein-serine/threonine kinase
VLLDREGHLKLSDFGLATGFHKMHDSTYYQKLLSSETNLEGEETKNIELTLSRKDRIETWKKNRRHLVIYLANYRHIQLLGLRIILRWKV